MARNYSDLLEAWMKHNETSSAPAVYTKWSMLSVIAGVLERKVWLMHRQDLGWYPNMFVFVIGPTGSGKSTAARAAMSLMRELPVNFLATQLNPVSLFHDLSAIGKKKIFEYNGDVYHHSAATLFASEASQTFTAQYKNGSIIGALTDLYDGSHFGWSKLHGESRSTMGSGQVTVYNPCLNMLACSTPNWFSSKVLTRDDAVGGFGSRILIAASKENLEITAADDFAGVDAVEDVQTRQRLISDLKEIHQMRGSYAIDKSYKDQWNTYKREFLEWQKFQQQAGTFAGYQERKLTHLAKLAMILAASRRNELIIYGEELRDAWELLNEIEPSMIEILDDLESSPEAKLRREIMEMLKKRGKNRVLKSEIAVAFQRHESIKVKFAIDALVMMGKLVPEEHERGRTVYTVIQMA